MHLLLLVSDGCSEVFLSCILRFMLCFLTGRCRSRNDRRWKLRCKHSEVLCFHRIIWVGWYLKRAFSSFLKTQKRESKLLLSILLCIGLSIAPFTNSKTVCSSARWSVLSICYINNPTCLTLSQLLCCYMQERNLNPYIWELLSGQTKAWWYILHWLLAYASSSACGKGGGDVTNFASSPTSQMLASVCSGGCVGVVRQFEPSWC